MSSKGRGGGDPDDPWTHLTNRISLYVQDDFQIRPDLTLNLGLRWAYTSPLVEKDNRQSNFDVALPSATGPACRPSRQDGSTEDRALYKPYYGGWEPRVGFAWRPSDRWVVRGGYGISQYMEGTGSNLRLPMNPPFFFESNVNYDTVERRRHDHHGLRRARARDRAVRAACAPSTRTSGRSSPSSGTSSWSGMLTSSMSAQVGYVGHHATNLVAPVEGNQPLPGVGRPLDLGAPQTRGGPSSRSCR